MKLTRSTNSWKTGCERRVSSCVRLGETGPTHDARVERAGGLASVLGGVKVLSASLSCAADHLVSSGGDVAKAKSRRRDRESRQSISGERSDCASPLLGTTLQESGARDGELRGIQRAGRFHLTRERSPSAR